MSYTVLKITLCCDMYLDLSNIAFVTQEKACVYTLQQHIITFKWRVQKINLFWWFCHPHQFISGLSFFFQHTDALVQSLFNEAVSAPIAIDKIIPSKLVDREMDNQSKTELPQNQWNIQPKQKLSSREEHEEDETALTKISRG